MTAATPPVPVSESTHLGIERTFLAHERTLMAWVRTSTSLISFGFTIYKFFQYLRESNQSTGPQQAFGPRHFAMVMLSVGVLCLVLATVNHSKSLAKLRARYGTDHVPSSQAVLLAGLIGALGVAGLVMMTLRL